MANKQVDNDIIFSDMNPEYVRRQKEEQQRKLEKVRRRQYIQFGTRFLLGFCVVAAIYLFSNVSKIREITISGNPYLSKDYVMELAGINYNTRTVFVFPSYVSARLNSNPLIESSDVVVDGDGTVRIDLTMKKALAYYWNEDAPYIILDTGKEVALDPNLYSTLTSIPMLRSFDTEQQRKALIDELKNLDSQVIEAIAEIWPFTESYDPNMYRFIMSDGNQVFMSKDGISLMSSYYGIAANLEGKKVCLMLNEETNSAYTRSCDELNQEEIDALAELEALNEKPSEEKEGDQSEEATPEEEVTNTEETPVEESSGEEETSEP